MARTFYPLAALLLLGATACRRTDVTPADQGIMGEWHWVSMAGGIAGQTYTPASTGYAETLVFNLDSTYRRVSTPQSGPPVTATGTFSVGLVKSIYTGKASRMLTLRESQTQMYILEELTTRLILADNHYDGFRHTYER